MGPKKVPHMFVLTSALPPDALIVFHMTMGRLSIPLLQEKHHPTLNEGVMWEGYMGMFRDILRCGMLWSMSAIYRALKD